jgi:NTE family protein
MSAAIALALSSGGARGYAHIGVIEMLGEMGYEIQAIAGTSMGAVVGGMYAAGGLSRFKEWALQLERGDVFKLYDFVFSSQGLIRGERVFQQIEEHIPDCRIEDLPIPFAAVATDLDRREEVVFRSGSLYDALRASSAIPAVVTPIELDGREMVDGGILNPLPVRYLRRKPGDLLVAVDVNAGIAPREVPKSKEAEKEESEFRQTLESLARRWFRKESHTLRHTRKKLGFFELLMRSIDMMQDSLTQRIIEESAPDVVIRVSRATCNTFDYYKAEALIAEGRIACLKAFEEYEGRRRDARESAPEPSGGR